MYTFLLVIIYIAFVSLGLPDSVLGAAWPSMHQTLQVPEGYAGLITLLIYTGTTISSMATGWLNQRLGTGKVILFSVMLTAITMYGFSISDHFLQLCAWALPYGLGGGCIDATLNNYIVLYYKPRHTSFLHCFWGLGTIISPLIMGAFLERGGMWMQGYQAIAIFQMVLTGILFLSLPLWKKTEEAETITEQEAETETLPLMALFRTRGVKASVAAFFCYTSIETSIGLWASSFLIDARGIDIVTATRCSMLFFIGIMSGRIISGFISERFGDLPLIRWGIALSAVSSVLLLLPSGSSILPFSALILMGIGCGPIFPCMIHHSPCLVGTANSQTLIGMQLAAASAGSILMPALFGVIVQHLHIGVLPLYALLFSFLLMECLRRLPVCHTPGHPPTESM